MKFRTKIVVLFIISILVQGVAIGYFSYNYANGLAQKSRKENIDNMINMIDININSKIRHIDEIVSNINNEEVVYAAKDKDNKNELKNSLTNLAKQIDVAIGDVKSLVLVNNDTMYYKNLDFDNITEFDKKYFVHSEILEKSKTNPGKLFWSDITEPFVTYTNKNEDIIIASYGIDEDIILVLELKKEGFSSLIPLAQDIFKDQYIFVLDNNNIIVSSNKFINETWIEFIEENKENNIQTEMEIDNERYYAKNQFNGVTGWKTFAFVSTDRIFTENNVLRDFTLYFVALSVVFFSLMALIISYGLTKPLRKLHLAMENAEKNDYTNQLENNKKDEIGDLTEAFNNLIGRVNKLVNDVYLSKITQKNAEIEALESQINPHFLYNTLDSINWMLLDKEEYEISDVIISLGNILKYSMDGNNALVSIEQEIKNIGDYLYIQKNRFEDKIKYEIEIPKDMYIVKVPKLILQPIVENSIIHGVDSVDYEISIKITIKAYFKEDRIYIEIIDNGIGMSKYKMEELNSSLTGDMKDLNSIGLKNVCRRIKLYFGDDYGIKIFSEEGVGTKVVIIVPREGTSEK